MSNVNTELHFLAFTEPKKGQSAEEFEDAHAANAALGRFAIADGATESSYAGLWAKLLVNEFVNTTATEPGNWADWLPALQTRWEKEVGQRPMSWYAEMKWHEGAFATLLGLVVNSGRWRAWAVGDSCLFLIRNRELCCSFPVKRSCDFCCAPSLISSRGFVPPSSALMREGLGARGEQHLEGEFLQGDRLWLMTDALALWFLHAAEMGERPWELLEHLLTATAAAATFKDWMRALRGAAQIRNDDVTLMAIW